MSPSGTQLSNFLGAPVRSVGIHQAWHKLYTWAGLICVYTIYRVLWTREIECGTTCYEMSRENFSCDSGLLCHLSTSVTLWKAKLIVAWTSQTFSDPQQMLYTAQKLIKKKHHLCLELSKSG